VGRILARLEALGYLTAADRAGNAAPITVTTSLRS